MAIELRDTSMFFWQTSQEVEENQGRPARRSLRDLLIGLALNFTGVNPIRALVFTFIGMARSVVATVISYIKG